MAGTFESYDAPIGTGATKEDLDPKLNLLAQMETPFYSSIGRGTARNTNPALIERDLNVAATNAQLENFQFSTVLAAAPNVTDGTRRSFTTQIFAKPYSVSGTEQATDGVTYEGKKRLAEQRAINGLELKRDIEFACVNAANAAVPGNTSTDREFASYWSQIDSSTTTAMGAASATNGYDVGTVFEDLINANAAELYASGGLTYKMGNSFVKNANVLLVTPAVKVAFDKRLDAKTSTYRMTNSGSMLGVDVTKYGSSFGDLMVCPDIHVGATFAGIYNPMNWKWLTLRPTHEQEYAKTGDGENRGLVHEGTLMHRHQKASGAITGLAVAS